MMRVLDKWLFFSFLALRLACWSKVNRARVICWSIISLCMSAKIISYLILAEYLNQPTRILPGSGPQDKDASDKIDS